LQADLDDELTHWEEVTVTREYTGIHLPTPLTAESINDLIDTFKHDEPTILHRKYCSLILRQVGEILKKEPNVNRIRKPSASHSVTVVGDLHGSLIDLATLLDIGGWPSAEHTIIFNGDFVDRGDFGTEVIMVLFALKIVFPEYVFLNRGNHEDDDICRAYGFAEEVVTKYTTNEEKNTRRGEKLFAQICRTFAMIPLCAVIEETAFVVHGGLFRSPSVGLAEINEIDRFKYITTLAPQRTQQHNDSKQMDQAEALEDMVWSDPENDDSGRCMNEVRAAGIIFGNDVTREFCGRLGVKHLVRSHECIEQGAEMWDAGDDYKVWTVFSASHYSNGANQGAILTFKESPETFPKVHRYSVRPVVPAELAEKNAMSLVDLIIQYKHLILTRCESFENKPDEAHLTLEQWSSIMNEVLELNIDWSSLQQKLAPTDETGHIDYAKFLQKYKVELSEEYKHDIESSSLEALYSNHKQLQVIFRFLDTDHSGEIDLAEFVKGCSILNQNLDLNSPRGEKPPDNGAPLSIDTKLSNGQNLNPELRQVDGAELFNIIDIDGSGAIDFNELCECFRLHGVIKQVNVEGKQRT